MAPRKRPLSAIVDSCDPEEDVEPGCEDEDDEYDDAAEVGGDEEAAEEDAAEECAAEESPENVAASASTVTKTRGKTSNLWHMFEAIKGDEKKYPHHARCKASHCRAIISIKSGTTTGLRNHAAGQHRELWASCKDGNTLEEAMEQKTKMRGGPLDKHMELHRALEPFHKGEWRWDVCSMIVEGEDPFSKVEQVQWRRAFRQYRPRPPFFSRRSLDRYLDTLEEIYSKRLREMFSEAPGRFSFTTDMWSSPNLTPFMAITCHWITKEWKLHHLLVDFKKVYGCHAGTNIAEHFSASLQQWGIQDRICGITADNASNNNTFMEALRDVHQLPGFVPGSRINPTEQRFRCFAHCVNIAVQAAVESEEIKEPLRKFRAFISWLNSSGQHWNN